MTMTNEELQALKDSYDGMADGVKDLIVTLKDREDVGVYTTLSITRLALRMAEFDRDFAKVFNDLSKDVGSDVILDDSTDMSKEIAELRATAAALQILIDVTEKHKE